MGDVMNRREFLYHATIGTAGLALSASLGTSDEEKTSAQKYQLPKRQLGATGIVVPVLGLGCSAVFLSAPSDEVRERILQRAFELGVRYWDTAAAYGGGKSEQLLGSVLVDDSIRKKVFIATKSGARTYDTAMRQLERSLKHLRTDYIDLWQMHNLRQGDVERLKSKNGAGRAFRKAKDEGIARFIGVTGHSSARVLIDAINSFEPDTVLGVFNAARVDNGRFEDELLPLAVKRKMGIIVMKVARHIRKPGIAVSELIRYALGLPVSVVLVGVNNPEHIEENVRKVCTMKPMTPQERDALHKRVAMSMRGQRLPYMLTNYRDDGVIHMLT